MKFIIKLLGLLLIFISGTSVLLSQTAEAPFHRQKINKSLGVHNGISIDVLDASGVTLPENQPSPARTIAFPESSYQVVNEHIRTAIHAPWLQLVFEKADLGKNSYIVITSEFDQDKQYFNNLSIAEWKYHSAFFKGEAVSIELFVAPGDENITVVIKEVIVGEYADGIPVLLSLCGADDRLTSSYPHIDGRLMPLGCTGWISAAGYYLTAGHCLDVSSASLQIMEFEVPASLPNGTTQPAAVNNQYPVIYASRVFQNIQIGDDWGIYNCGANSNTGLTPAQARRAYYHLSRDLNPPNIFIRGFGTDETPPGTTGWRNAQNQTLQYNSGPSLGEFNLSSNRIYWEYQADTEGGNSGSAVLANGVSGVDFTSVGIHTNAGCGTNSGNTGTSFEADDVESAMNTFWQAQTVFVDGGHHRNSTEGTSVRPRKTIQGALNLANAGHGSGRELIMVAGSNFGDESGVYAETVSYSGATHGVIIRRSVGAVKIGPGATLSILNNNTTNGEK